MGSLTEEEPCYGTSATAVVRTDESQPKYIRITDFDDYGIAPNHQYMTAESYSGKHFLKEGDVLFARSGATVGKTYYYDGSIGSAVFAGYCIRFRFDDSKILPKFAYWYTKTSAYTEWVKGIQRPSGQPNINKEEFKSFEIIVPDLSSQARMIRTMDSAVWSMQDRFGKVINYLRSFQEFIVDKYSLLDSRAEVFYRVIRNKDLDGVIDAKRYLKTKKVGSQQLSDICDIIEEKTNVTKYGNQTIDWIRIDDLPNNPIDIETVRTTTASAMEGSFFEVKKDDILVARLGPTILNQKIVLVRSIERPTLASAEFLVLRCKAGYNPEAVMAILKTEYYRDLMYSHSRGSTPSRYRLNREDALKLPFPDIRESQDALAAEALRVRDEVLKLRREAIEEWENAKEQFEKALLGES